jgi:hypothetical protein
MGLFLQKRGSGTHFLFLRGFGCNETFCPVHSHGLDENVIYTEDHLKIIKISD